MSWRAATAISTLSWLAFSSGGTAQSTSGESMKQGGRRMDIRLQRLNANGEWRTIDPALVLDQGDRVRFGFRTDFDGFLYVMNQSTSGKYEQLFPRQDTGQDNRIGANKDYQVPATSAAFRISGPAGQEVVYWLVTPARLTEASPRLGAPPPDLTTKPLTMIPRCDDTVFQARGDCVDNSAGVKLVPRGEEVPRNLKGAAAAAAPRDLLFMRDQDQFVISSKEPFTGPVIYEFRLAHR